MVLHIFNEYICYHFFDFTIPVTSTVYSVLTKSGRRAST